MTSKTNLKLIWTQFQVVSVEVIPKIIIFSRGGIRSSYFQLRLDSRQSISVEAVLNSSFSVEVVLEIGISVEVVLKVGIVSRGGTENLQPAYVYFCSLKLTLTQCHVSQQLHPYLTKCTSPKSHAQWSCIGRMGRPTRF